MLIFSLLDGLYFLCEKGLLDDIFSVWNGPSTLWVDIFFFCFKGILRVDCGYFSLWKGFYNYVMGPSLQSASWKTVCFSGTLFFFSLASQSLLQDLLQSVPLTLCLRCHSGQWYTDLCILRWRSEKKSYRAGRFYLGIIGEPSSLPSLVTVREIGWLG